MSERIFCKFCKEPITDPLEAAISFHIVCAREFQKPYACTLSEPIKLLILVFQGILDFWNLFVHTNVFSYQLEFFIFKHQLLKPPDELSLLDFQDQPHVLFKLTYSTPVYEDNPDFDIIDTKATLYDGVSSISTNKISQSLFGQLWTYYRTTEFFIPPTFATLDPKTQKLAVSTGSVLDSFMPDLTNNLPAFFFRGDKLGLTSKDSHQFLNYEYSEDSFYNEDVFQNTVTFYLADSPKGKTLKDVYLYFSDRPAVLLEKCSGLFKALLDKKSFQVVTQVLQIWNFTTIKLITFSNTIELIQEDSNSKIYIGLEQRKSKRHIYLINLIECSGITFADFLALPWQTVNLYKIILWTRPDTESLIEIFSLLKHFTALKELTIFLYPDFKASKKPTSIELDFDQLPAGLSILKLSTNLLYLNGIYVQIKNLHVRKFISLNVWVKIDKSNVIDDVEISVTPRQRNHYLKYNP